MFLFFLFIFPTQILAATLQNVQSTATTTYTVKSPQGWEIEKFKSNIDIQLDGKVNTVENINVNFHDLSKHGIFRDIPNIYATASGSAYTRVDVYSVNRNGQAEPFQVYQNGNFLEIKIGDANHTISGNQNYEIGYITSGVLKSFPDYDELYWNVTGNSWAVPILSTEATVSIPQDKIMLLGCFEGYSKSVLKCISNVLNSRSVIFNSSRPYGPSEGMTVIIAYTKGIVPILTITEPQFPPTPTPAPYVPPVFGKDSAVAFFMTFFGVLLFVTFIWMKGSRDKYFLKSPLVGGSKKEQSLPFFHKDTIVVEYTPPDNLRPAEIGVLMDERADTLDVTSTIIDLATRGYLTITEVEKKGWFGSSDYTLTKKKKDDTSLLNYEKLLLQKLFDDGDKVNVSDLKTTFYSSLLEVKKKLYEEMVAKKYFLANPETTRNTYTGIAVVLIIISFIFIGFGMVLPTGIVTSIATGVFFPSILLLIFSRSMSARTALGHELYRRVRGYELFIGHVEKYRQQFFEKKNMFNTVLPYAIVLGLTEKFANAMKDMGMMPKSTTWYYGTSNFNYLVFSNNINSFSSSFSGAIASSPARSGFSSGGGFSGGGFSGGGGGSW